MADMAPPLAFPALHASHAGIWIASPDGETRRVGKAEAVARAAEEAEAGEVVLLAPAAASFDQYPNFEKRGEDFTARVKALIG